MRSLLIVGGPFEAVPGVERARSLGLRVIVSDIDPRAPGLLVADDRLLASTYDVEETVGAAKRYHEKIAPIAGVISVGSDVPLTVAAVAHELGLPGIPVEAARLTADKLAMKDALSQAGVPVPWYKAVASTKELAEIVRSQHGPFVIKPVDSRGARGVVRLASDVDLLWAFEQARENSPTQRVMVESYLTGPQVSTESLMLDGKAHTPGFSDRNYQLLDEYAPYFIEDGGELPSCLPEGQQAAVRALIAPAARSLGIVNGVLKGDVVLHDEHPYIIEVAARLSGGYFCSHEIPLSSGVDFLGAAIRLAIGDMPKEEELTPTRHRAVAQRYIFPEPGVVESVLGEAEVAAREGIEMCVVKVKPGDLVSRVDSHPGRAGVVIAVGDDRHSAIARAERAVSDIHVVTRADNMLA